jgi:hypothetical protein
MRIHLAHQPRSARRILRHLLDLAGVDQQQLPRTPFQHVPDRLPQHSRGFHRHLRHGLSRQKIAQRQEIVGHRAEGAQHLSNFTVPVGHAYASDHGVPVDVQTGNALIRVCMAVSLVFWSNRRATRGQGEDDQITPRAPGQGPGDN